MRQTIRITVQSTVIHSAQKVVKDLVLILLIFAIMLKLEVYEAVVIPNAISTKEDDGHYYKDRCNIIE